VKPVNLAVTISCAFLFAHEAAGASRTRHSPRPHLFGADNSSTTRALRVAGLRRCVALCVVLPNARTHNHNHLLEQKPLASVPNPEAAAYGSPRPVRNCALGGDDVESGERLKSSVRV